MNETPFFSVIIPFKNAQRTIRNCLEGIQRQTFAPCEFIFVDNVSEDRSPRIVNDFISTSGLENVHCLIEEKAGASSARNAGVRRAKGKWIVFTDSDCIISYNWLDDFRSAIKEDPSCAAFAGCIQPAASRNMVARFLGLYTLPANTEKKTCHAFELIRGGFPTANFAIRKDVFDSIGGFNEQVLIYGEDYELCSRIYESGNYITALTDAVIHHVHREDAKGLFRQSFGFGRSHAYCLRHLVKGAFIADLPGFSTVQMIPHLRIWVDLNQLEKKVSVLLLLNMLFPPSVLLTIIYFGYLVRKNINRSKARGIAVSVPEAVYFTCLLLVKSFCMGAGRIKGSFMYKVVCF
jgi:GT2 family glycosyltransferase